MKIKSNKSLRAHSLRVRNAHHRLIMAAALASQQEGGEAIHLFNGLYVTFDGQTLAYHQGHDPELRTVVIDRCIDDFGHDKPEKSYSQKDWRLHQTVEAISDYLTWG